MSKRAEKVVGFNQMNTRPTVEPVPGLIIIAEGVSLSASILTEAGAVVIDVSAPGAPRVIKALQEKGSPPIHTLVYTHFHRDHTGGSPQLLKYNLDNNYPRFRIIAQEELIRPLGGGVNSARRVNYLSGLQFGRGYKYPAPNLENRVYTNALAPDTLYQNSMQFTVGKHHFHLFHEMGETTDCTWVWIPEIKAAVIGDLLIGGCPNAGNPFRTQRNVLEWAKALENIAGYNPEWIIPGGIIPGGTPYIAGAECREALLVTASLLHYLQHRVAECLEKGYFLEETLEAITIPEEYQKSKWLSPIYGCPNFVIHDIYNRYNGWFTGNAVELAPSRAKDRAREVVDLSGGPRLLARAKELQKKGEIQLALHLVDWLEKGSRDSKLRKDALLLKAALFDAKAEVETNGILKNTYLMIAEASENEALAL